MTISSTIDDDEFHLNRTEAIRLYRIIIEIIRYLEPIIKVLKSE